MYKFSRGTSYEEAQALEEGIQHRSRTYWTDSKEKASMYGAVVIEIEMMDLPPHFDLYKSIAHGNSIHGTIRQWILPKEYYEETVYNYIEIITIF